jgi:hypothetical protein
VAFKRCRHPKEDNDLPPPEIVKAVADRRKRFRFQMDAELRYQICGGDTDGQRRGTGKVENISSKALAFRSDGPPIERGMRLSISLAWPAKIDQAMLRLAFDGTVLRTRGNLVVLTIEHPEFRTAGKSTAPTPEEIGRTASGAKPLLVSKGDSLAC